MRTATVTFKDSKGRVVTGVLKARSPQLSSKPEWIGDRTLLNSLSHQLNEHCLMDGFIIKSRIFSREQKLAMKVSYSGTYDIISELRL